MFTNLRPSATIPGALVPVGAPIDAAPQQGWRLLCTLPNGLDIFYSGSQLRYGCTDIDLPGEPRCGIPGLDGSIIVMLADGVISVDIAEDNTVTISPRAPLSSPVTLTCKDRPEISIYNPGISTAVYSPDSRRLNAADTRAISAALVADYRKLCARAHAAGAFIQPVIGYYRIRNAQGRVIYTSCPVLLGPSAGPNCTGRIDCSLNHDTLSGTGSFTTSATPYSIQLRLSSFAPSKLLRAAERIEVFLTPQLHPVDADALAETRISRSSSATQLTVAMPGATVALEPAGNLPARAEALMARIDTAARHTFTLSVTPTTFSPSSPAVSVHRYYCIDFDEENKKARSLAAAPLTDSPSPLADSIKALCQPPHSFSAAKATVVGDAPVWADISPTLFDGYAPAEMARDGDMRPDGAALSTVYTDAGDILAVSSAGEATLTPSLLSPLLCYPHPSAARISVCVKDSLGQWRRVDRALHSAPGSRYAYSIDPSLTPIPIADAPTVALTLETPRKIPRRFPGTIITADMQDPLLPIAVSVPSTAPIERLMPAPRATAGWNFSHSRLYIFSSSGTCALSISGKRIPGAPVMLDPRPVTSASAAQGRAIAVAGGDLIAFDSTRPVTIAASVADAGYSPPTRELWALMTDGSIRVYPDGSTDYYLRDIPGIIAFDPTPTALYAALADGRLINCSSETCPDLIPIRLHWEEGASRPLMKNLMKKNMQSLTLSLAASAVSGTVELRLHNGAGPDHSALVTRLTLNGPVNAPITIPVTIPALSVPGGFAAGIISPPRYYIKLSLLVSPDFRLYSIQL